jgi:hypothetical protein
METNIKIQIHALQPRWIELEQARYRLYVNNDLITERTWTWDIDTVIEENVCVNVAPKVNHSIRLECIKVEKGHLTQLGLRNFSLNGIEFPDHGGHRDELSFILE